MLILDLLFTKFKGIFSLIYGNKNNNGIFLFLNQEH